MKRTKDQIIGDIAYTALVYVPVFVITPIIVAFVRPKWIYDIVFEKRYLWDEEQRRYVERYVNFQWIKK